MSSETKPLPFKKLLLPGAAAALFVGPDPRSRVTPTEGNPTVIYLGFGGGSTAPWHKKFYGIDFRLGSNLPEDLACLQWVASELMAGRPVCVGYDSRHTRVASFLACLHKVMTNKSFDELDKESAAWVLENYVADPFKSSSEWPHKLVRDAGIVFPGFNGKKPKKAVLVEDDEDEDEVEN